MGDAFHPFWSVPFWLEWLLYGKKAQDSLESRSSLHFLDNLED